MKLDLSVFENKTMEIIMLDNVLLHIKKPTQKQLILLSGYDIKMNETKTLEDKLKILNEIAVLIVNNNQENKKYEINYFENLNVDILYAIYFGYQKFITEVMENPN